MVHSPSAMLDLIIFDWENTVMRDFPDFGGPMVTWPRVETMPGIRRALESLARGYRLVLASNAYESDAQLAQQALQRVDLAVYFHLILTSHELGAAKPDPLFFEQVLVLCDTVPHRAAMVGDNFRTDIVGAKYAGLWTVWYNPAGNAPPPDVPFAADAEIRSFDELLSAIQRLDQLAGSSI